MRVALSGRSGAGKTEIATYLHDVHKFEVCHSGRYIRNLARELFDTEAKDVTNRLTDCINSIQQGAVLKAAIRRVVDNPGVSLVVDSLRFPEDYEFVRSAGMVLWRVEAPTEVRLRRLASRGQIYNPATDELHATETALEGFSFDRVIKNEGPTLNDLHRELQSILAQP